MNFERYGIQPVQSLGYFGLFFGVSGKKGIECEKNLFSPRNLKAKQGFVKIAEKYNINVYHLVFNHTHCHACLLIPSQKSYVDFVRELTAGLTRHFSKVAHVNFSKVFLHRPYTRIVEWGRSFFSLLKYFEKNIRESGFPQPKPATFASRAGSAIQLSLNLFETG